MSKTEETLEPGTVFGNYEIVRVMGAGAFGAVYEARRMPLRKRVALKVLHKKLVTQPEIVARFIREAETTAQLHHPHIVETFDVGTQDGAPFLAMEYLEGEALNERIARSKKLPMELAVDVMIPVLSAMAAVHAQGIIHRDLKPDNIYLERTRAGVTHPKILDFGIAKVTTLEGEHVLTRTTALLGTPYYMSPEQAKESKHIDARSDQWALGVILFECLSGKKPFGGSSLLELLTRISMNQHPPLCELAPEVPKGLAAVVDHAMQTEPAARFPDVREFARALLPYASSATQLSWEAEFAADSDVTAKLPDVHVAAVRSRSVAPPAASESAEAADSLTTPKVRSSETMAMESEPLPPAGATLAVAESAPEVSDSYKLGTSRPTTEQPFVGTLTLSARESLLPKSTPAPPPRRKSQPVLIAGAAVALTVVALGSWFASRTTPNTPTASHRTSPTPPSAIIPPPEELRTESRPAPPTPPTPPTTTTAPVAPVAEVADAGTPATPPATNDTAHAGHPAHAPHAAPTPAQSGTEDPDAGRSRRRARRSDAGAAAASAPSVTETPAVETGSNGVGIR